MNLVFRWMWFSESEFLMDESCFPLNRVQRVLICDGWILFSFKYGSASWTLFNGKQDSSVTNWDSLNPIQRKTRFIRHKLGLAEPYLKENKIHPSQIRTRWTLFKGKQDSSVRNSDSLNHIQRKTRYIRHKLGLAEPYSTENKIHPSQRTVFSES
jgi:hypothetical protein